MMEDPPTVGGDAPELMARDRRALVAGEIPEAVHPSPYQDWPLAFARDEFLSILDTVAPKVHQVLRESVLPLLGPALEAAPAGLLDLDEEALRGGPEAIIWFMQARDAGHAACIELDKALWAWAQRHHLDAEWVVDAALRTLIAYQQDPIRLDTPAWFSLWPAWRSALSEAEQYFQMEGIPHAWDPTVESSARARERFRAMAIKQFDEFLAQRRQLAEARGFGRPPQRKAPSQHLRWLVRRQVLGENYTEIAEADRRADPQVAGRKVVRNGVHQAAKLIGLNLRERDRGALSDR
jgi:hypothetical protein